MRSFAFVLLLMLASSAACAQTVVVENASFRSLLAENTKLEKIATGFRFLEGPAFDPQDFEMVFSDIPAGRLYRFDPGAPADNPTSVYRDPSNHANGNTYDAHGNLYTCEHGTRRVVRTHRNGPVEILAERFEGKLLNSPNDVVVKSDGTVWFTDPTYGLEKRLKEQTANRVYCLDPKTREPRAVAGDFDQPNGLCFSPDEKCLYVADSGKPHHVRVFDVGSDNALTNSRVFCVIDKGVPDGMRCDRHGNLWSSAGDGIHVFNPAGERLGKILVPETPTNLCFAGLNGRIIFITAQTSLYRIQRD